MIQESLQDIYNRNLKNEWPDKGTVHSYIEVYEKILEPYRFRYQAQNVLEIGIFSGQSLRMWEEYFSAKVWGIDYSDQPLGLMDLRPMIQEGTHNIIIMDATDSKEARKNFKDILFNVIIDDASHQLEHQLKSYEIFKEYLSPGGIYIIEDIQDIDKDRVLFEKIDPTKSVQILDRRSIKGRYDDVMVIIQ